jgi:pimeloyl-ACP methyl ester carboxylesterase/DNA-binding CsgD family transcriptional regulator
MSDEFDQTVARLERAALRGVPLEAWAEDPDAIVRLARHAGPLFGKALLTVAESLPPPGPVALPDLIAAAAVDADGGLVVADERFQAWFGVSAIDVDLARRVAAKRNNVIGRSLARDGAPVAMAYGEASHARTWALPEPVRDALIRNRARVAVVAVCPSRAGEVLARAAVAYGLTPAEARLVTALVQTGDLATAAEALGVLISTARSTLADVMRKMGVRRQSALISRVATTALGYWPRGASDPALLIDAFGLSERQARIALGVARGLSRKDAGSAAGASESVTKDELERIFETTGVASAQMLSRLVTETMALGMLAQVSNGELAPVRDAVEPLRLIPRPSGGMIAVSDYGPRSGRPVCILHSSATTRHASRSFVQALQQAGYRPLAIDRPGFGLSDPAPTVEDDPFDAAGADVATVCGALEIHALDIIARGGVYAAMAFARQAPERVGAVVVLNPDTPAIPGARPGIIGAMTDTILLHPDRLTLLARIIAGEATSTRVARLLRQALVHSPPDLAAFEDSEAVADYQRAVRHFAAGRVDGLIAEQRALVAQPERAPLPGQKWRVIFGAHDPLHRLEHAEAHWRMMLPDAQFERVADGGRFLYLTHPELVIAALRA